MQNRCWESPEKLEMGVPGYDKIRYVYCLIMKSDRHDILVTLLIGCLPQSNMKPNKVSIHPNITLL